MRAEALLTQRTAWVDEVIPARERELYLAEAEHAGGRADVTAVLRAKLELVAARADLIGIDHDLAQQLIAALYTLGLPPTEWLAHVPEEQEP
jgi:outer membrane protein TolC